MVTCVRKIQNWQIYPQTESRLVLPGGQGTGKPVTIHLVSLQDKYSEIKQWSWLHNCMNIVNITELDRQHIAL